MKIEHQYFHKTNLLPFKKLMHCFTVILRSNYFDILYVLNIEEFGLYASRFFFPLGFCTQENWLGERESHAFYRGKVASPGYVLVG